jgi:hypothetical protein
VSWSLKKISIHPNGLHLTYVAIKYTPDRVPEATRNKNWSFENVVMVDEEELWKET